MRERRSGWGGLYVFADVVVGLCGGFKYFLFRIRLGTLMTLRRVVLGLSAEPRAWGAFSFPLRLVDVSTVILCQFAMYPH